MQAAAEAGAMMEQPEDKGVEEWENMLRKLQDVKDDSNRTAQLTGRAWSELSKREHELCGLFFFKARQQAR